MNGLRVAVVALVCALPLLSASPLRHGKLHFSQVACNFKGDLTYAPYEVPSYEMSGDTEKGVSLTLERTWGRVPYVYSGEFWRQNEACYQAIVNVTTTGIKEIGYRAFAGLQRLKRIEGDDQLVTFGPYSFAGSSLSEIVVPNLAVIGEGAFQYSTGLSGTLTVPGSILSIGHYAYQGTKLSVVDVTAKPEGFSFGDGVFSDCYKLTEFVVNEGFGTWNFNSVGLFEGCSELLLLTGLRRCSIVGPRTFRGCASLTTSSFSFNGFCTEFGDSAFEGCNFYELDLRPCSSLARVGSAVFKDCFQLQTIYFDSKIAPVLTSETSQSLFEGCLVLRSTSSFDTTAVTSIPARFFYGCQEFDGSVFADKGKLKSIGNSAFEGTATTTFDLSQVSGCTIGTAAFRNCEKLQTFKLPNDATVIPTSLCQNCPTLTSVTGSTVTAIDAWAFYKCSSLGGLTVGAVTNVGSWAFCGCVLFSVTTFVYNVKDSLVSLGVSAFEDTDAQDVNLQQCSVLKHNELPASLFRGCGNMNKCTLSPDMSILPPSFFERCWKLNNLVWERDSFSSVTIGASAFNGCSEMTDTKYLAGSQIGDYAFESTGFTELDLTSSDFSSLNSVRGKGIFKNCYKLTKCTFGNDFTEIPEEMFAGCQNLVEVQPTSQFTFVGIGAFKGCSKFSDPDMLRVTSIAADAFAGTGYTRIDFAETANGFYTGAFQDCQNLEWVNLASFGTWLPDHIFAGCSKLSTIEGLDQIQSFGTAALMGCPLTSIPFSQESQSWSSQCFEGTLLQSLDLTNVPISNIPDATFRDCKDLSEVTLSSHIYSIGAQAFQGCTSLRSITLPESVSSLGLDCFRDCTSLETVNYQGTSLISGSIFQGCTSLTTVTVPSNYPYDNFGDWQFNSGGDESGEDGDGSKDGNSLPPGGVAGIVIAVLIIVGVAVFLAVFFLVIRKRRNDLAAADEDESPDNTSSIHI